MAIAKVGTRPGLMITSKGSQYLNTNTNACEFKSNGMQEFENTDFNLFKQSSMSTTQLACSLGKTKPCVHNFRKSNLIS